MVTLYGIKNCDTCRKARKALDGIGLSYRFHDLREDGLTAPLIEHFFALVPLTTLLNKRSTTWRHLDDATKAADLDADMARALMLAHPTLLKRPLLDTGEAIRVGFRNGDYVDLQGRADLQG